MENLLEVQDLTKIFGAGGGRPVTAADHVTFPSGRGKPWAWWANPAAAKALWPG